MVAQPSIPYLTCHSPLIFACILHIFLASLNSSICLRWLEFQFFKILHEIKWLTTSNSILSTLFLTLQSLYKGCISIFVRYKLIKTWHHDLNTCLYVIIISSYWVRISLSRKLTDSICSIATWFFCPSKESTLNSFSPKTYVVHNIIEKYIGGLLEEAKKKKSPGDFFSSYLSLGGKSYLVHVLVE